MINQEQRNNESNKNTFTILVCDAKISIISQKKRRLTVFRDFLTLKNIVHWLLLKNVIV